MDLSVASPSFVLPPMPPGYAWGWTAQGWTPIPYTGPMWTPPTMTSSPAAPSSQAPSSQAPARDEHASTAHGSPAALRATLAKMTARDPQLAAAREAYAVAFQRATQAREHCAAVLAPLGIEAHDETRLESTAQALAPYDARIAAAFQCWAAAKQDFKARASVLGDAIQASAARISAAQRAAPAPAAPSPPAPAPAMTSAPSSPDAATMTPETWQRIIRLAQGDQEIAASLTAWIVAAQRTGRAREQCRRALAAIGVEERDDSEVERTTRALAVAHPHFAEALRALDAAKQTSSTATLALCAAMLKALQRLNASKAPSDPATPPATTAPSSPAAEPATSSTTAQTPSSASNNTAPATPPATAAPDTADLLADVPPWIVTLADQDARVSAALGDLYAARAARLAAERRASEVLAGYGSGPTDRAQCLEWMARLAAERPDVAEAVRAWQSSAEATAGAEAALSRAVAPPARPSNDADTGAPPPASTTRTRTLEPELGAGSPADPTPLDWARSVAERDPRVAHALGEYLAAQEAARAAGERFEQHLARHGPFPEEHAARAAWVRDLCERDHDAAAAMRAGLAALEQAERASTQLAEALRSHTRSPPKQRAAM